MEDPGVVAAIAAGDPGGIEQAYDRYATPLFSYCCSMLRDPVRAAYAVQDTFVIATARVRGLQNPARFRPWLYAVARNECMHRLRAATSTASPGSATRASASGGDQDAASGRAGLLAPLREAADGLSPAQRDVILLSLGHDLTGDELADVLGVSRNRAQARASRAQRHLEQSLGALIGASTELTPALLAEIAPPAALAGVFRAQALHAIADRGPAGLAHRFSVVDRAGPFGPSGFPRAVRSPRPVPWQLRSWQRELWDWALRHRQAIAGHARAVVAGAAAVVAAAGVVAAMVIGGHHARPATAHTGQPAHRAAGGTGPSSAPG